MDQMHQISTRRCNFNIKKTILWRISTTRRRMRSFWSKFHACLSPRGSIKYQHFQHAAFVATVPPSSPPANGVDHGNDSSDLVSLKITLFGDAQVGKTSFLAKYAGEEKEGKGFALSGEIHKVDKIMDVQGARISYNIWEVGASDHSSLGHVPDACKDSVAMIFMFDLTSRRTLNSVIKWYQVARKSNQTANTVLVGTKFDEFVQLPLDLQWTIAMQARSYAKAMNATLFFSSATYNINVNKIFKFITAKLFNLHWNLERNLTVGEPIIDF